MRLDLQRILLSILALTLLAASAVADNSARERLASELPGWLQQTNTPSAAVALIKDGQVRWTLVVGEQAAGVPATETTMYNVASLTKPITAEVILRLAADSRLALDESMAPHRVDPDLAGDPRHELLTAGLCLSHQCGLPNWRRDTDGTLKIVHDPGSRAAYSGEGYDYVARYAEARSGERFEALAASELFGPLGLADTAYTEQPWFENRVAVPHDRAGQPGEPALRSQWSAADDLHTTIGDYGAFVASVMRGEGLTPELSARRWQVAHDLSPMLCQSGRLAPEHCPERLGFAIGWGVHESAGGLVRFHGGGDWGERAFTFFVPQTGFGLVVLTNGAGGMTVIRDIVAALYDNEPFIAFLTMQAQP